jgi:hypothetical protein
MKICHINNDEIDFVWRKSEFVFFFSCFGGVVVYAWFNYMVGCRLVFTNHKNGAACVLLNSPKKASRLCLLCMESLDIGFAGYPIRPEPSFIM